MLNSKPNNLLSYAMLIGLLIVFFIVKLEYIALPYFWDEAWVYGHAVNYFIESGIRLFPNEASVEYTRGHPMFFTYICSLWGRLTSNSPYQIHFFVQWLSIFYLGFVFFKSRQWVHSFFAFGLILMYIANEAFFVQSHLVLPEVTLAFGLTVALIAFIQKNNFLFVLSYIAALYTKESAIVLLPVLAIYTLFIERPLSLQKWLERFKYVLLSLGIGFIHYLVQKIQFGWFLYPFHVEIMEFSMFTYNEQFRAFVTDHFLSNAQWILTVLGWVFWLLIAIKRNTLTIKGIRLYHVYLLSSVLMVCGFNWGNGFVFATMSFFIVLAVIMKTSKFKYKAMQPFLFAACVFMACYFAFNALNFYSSRYNMPIQFWSTVLLLFGVFEILFNNTKWAFGLVLIIFLSILILRNNERGFNDVDTYYKYAVRTHQDIANYCRDNIDPKSKINVEFLEKVVLGQPSAGYISKEEKFSNLGYLDEPDGEYIILSNIGTGIEAAKEKIDTASLNLIHTIRHRRGKAEIYKQK
ncbi:MAG: hypothetical protein HKN09_08470 [Saprospiraceae bacterium]|nr:hypothetical protein [Saprospiraceae bacterium]